MKKRLKDSFILRDCMVNFVKNYIYYLFNDVIEPNYLAFLKNLETANSMDDVINYHDKYLDNCINDGLMIDKLKGKLNEILNSCHYYCHFTFQYDNIIKEKSQEILQDYLLKKNIFEFNEFMKKKIKKKQKNNSLTQAFNEVEMKYSNLLKTMKNAYNNRLKDFLEIIKQINDNHKTNLGSLLIKIDFNNYYHELFEREKESKIEKK